MKKPFHQVVLALGLFGWIVGASNHVMAASAIGIATAHVMHSLSIGTTSGGEDTLTGSLTFGAFASSAEGIIEIDPSTCTVDSDISHFGGHRCARFKVGGYENAAYTISYEPNQTLVHAEMPTATMPYVLKLDNGDNRHRNLNGGSDEIQFGGALNVSPNSLPGVYTGNFQITINYQ